MDRLEFKRGTGKVFWLCLSSEKFFFEFCLSGFQVFGLMESGRHSEVFFCEMLKT